MELKQLHIIDTQTGQAVSYDALGFDSLVLNYNGGDDKIVDIVPSELQFSLIDKSATDGLLKFLTDDVRHYVVRVEMQINQNVFNIWEGYMVADEYTEQITGINREISFTAIDGIAYLKNVFFENYKQTLTLFELLQTILKKTGFNYPILFFPAIKNVSVEWDDIKIDLRHYKDVSMYDILKEILINTLTSVYKYRQYWYIEGINVKQSVRRKGKYIQLDGTVSDISISENVNENIKFLPDPEINFNYPPKRITVTESARKYDLKNLNGFSIDYILYSYIEKYKSYKWWGHNVELYNKSKTKSNYFLDKVVSYDNNKYAFTNMFVKKGAKIKITGTFKKLNSSDNAAAGDMRYMFQLKDEIIKANFDINGYVADLADIVLSYKDKDITMSYDFFANKDVFFQIYIYSIVDLEFTSFDIEITEPDADSVNIDVFNRGELQEYELDIFPDKRLLGKSFILDSADTFDQTITVDHTIYYTKLIDGMNALSIDMQAAIDIEAFPDKVTWNGNQFQFSKIIYNYMGGEAIYLLTDDMSVNTSHPIQVDTHSPYNANTDRIVYDQWFDNFYGIGNFTYKQTYLNILTSLQKEQHPRLSAVFNDIFEYVNFFKFDYNGNRMFRISNMSVNILRAETDVVAHECFYDVDTVTNHPPYIYAPSPIIIDESANAATLTAQIVDVDGVIDDVLWEKLSGTGGDIATPNAATTDITNVTDDYYKYMLSVTDDVGNESKYDIEVIRKKSIDFSVTELNSSEPSNCIFEWQNQLDVTNLKENDLLLVEAVTEINGLGAIWIEKNNQPIYVLPFWSIQSPVNFTISKDDDVKIFMRHFDCCDDYGGCHQWHVELKFKINRVRVLNGSESVGAINVPFEYVKTHN